MPPSLHLLSFLLLLFLHASVRAALPLVDFDRMGKVGLAGAFAGLDFFQNSSSPISFDPSTSSIFIRSQQGALTYTASTNQGGSVLAGCALDNVLYIAGSFSSIDSVSASNVASYDPSSNAFTALGSGGPNGQVDALYCDSSNSKVWAGGKFTSPGASVAVWDIKASSWSKPPFTGLAGAGAQVMAIAPNSTQTSLLFAGSFITAFGGSVQLNGTNNPNVPFSSGATPFSSSLVPIPLESAQVIASPSTTDAQFSNISNVLCPAGSDGPGSTWFAQDNSTALITVRAFSSLGASGIRLGNTFQTNHGTTGFSVTTIPDNTVRTLQYLDPATGTNTTCTNPCPLSTDSSVLYQDFLFSEPLGITGVQIKLSEWTGNSAGLHILQLLSSGAFASALDDNNGQSCYAPLASNATHTGDWEVEVANTNIAGTVQSVLVAEVPIGASGSSIPTFTWYPYVSASGDYEVNLLVPGCTNFEDCDARTTVSVEVFPGGNQQSVVLDVDQRNTEDASKPIYSGPVVPSSPDFVMTVTMTLSNNPAGSGENGSYVIVADTVQLVLTSANLTSNGSVGSNSSTSLGGQGSFGVFEWPLSSSDTADATSSLPNTSLSTLDSLGVDLFQGLGSDISSSSSVNSIVSHSSGTVFIGGEFNLSSGAASGSANILSFKNGAIVPLADSGLNGPVTSLAVSDNTLFVAGSFSDTGSGSQQRKLSNVAMYDIDQDQWSPLQEGVNGVVSSITVSGGQVQIAGNFTLLLSPGSSTTGNNAGGFAVWDISGADWVNSGGFLVGSLTAVGNGTNSTTQFIAGNVVASEAFGASGMVMISNGNDGVAQVTPMGIELGSDTSSNNPNSTASLQRRSHAKRGPGAWLSHIDLPRLFSRQSSTSSAPLALPSAAPALAPAVLAGAFWTNSSNSEEVAIIGGNFSFSASSITSQNVAIYNPDSTAISSLQGTQLNGVVRALLVDGDVLYVGGEFNISGTNANGFAMYDLSSQQWDLSNIQALQPSSGSSVVVRSITTSSSMANTIIIAGTFAQAGSLTCQAICSLDTSTRQWNALGSGISGEVAAVAYAGDNQGTLVAAGSIGLSSTELANVVQFTFSNSSWAAVGDSSSLPGPVTAMEVNDGNSSSIFAAGQSSDGSSSFLSFWNGQAWNSQASTLQGNSTFSQLTMVPLQNTHSANGVIEQDRMLMVSGLLSDSNFGNASTILYDGQTFIPYIVSTSFSGTAGAVSSLFHSFATFSFSQKHFLATGIVILISIAIAAGIVFLLALIGIVWTLFSRHDDNLNKGDIAEDDDDSVHHRPSSLLEHINAATRTTIMGVSPYSNYDDKEESKATANTGYPPPQHDVFSADASNYVRAETPSDAMGGMITEDMSRPAHARYSFDGSGEGELALSAGTEVEVLDDRDHAWWYARDPRTGKEGVVPAAYLY